MIIEYIEIYQMFISIYCVLVEAIGTFSVVSRIRNVLLIRKIFSLALPESTDASDVFMFLNTFIHRKYL